jgi:hypothetical protein
MVGIDGDWRREILLNATKKILHVEVLGGDVN